MTTIDERVTLCADGVEASIADEMRALLSTNAAAAATVVVETHSSPAQRARVEPSLVPDVDALLARDAPLDRRAADAIDVATAHAELLEWCGAVGGGFARVDDAGDALVDHVGRLTPAAAATVDVWQSTRYWHRDALFALIGSAVSAADAQTHEIHTRSLARRRSRRLLLLSRAARRGAAFCCAVRAAPTARAEAVRRARAVGARRGLADSRPATCVVVRSDGRASRIVRCGVAD